MYVQLTPSAVEAGSSVLLAGDDESVVREQLLAVLADGGGAALLVTAGDATAALERLDDLGLDRDRLGLVDASGACTVESGVAEVACVDGPGDLSGAGVEVSERLERLATRYDRVLVGVDSLSALLDARDLPAVFRFLHVLSGRVRASGAVLVAGLDRSGHDGETVGTVAELFDEVVEVEADAG